MAKRKKYRNRKLQVAIRSAIVVVLLATIAVGIKTKIEKKKETELQEAKIQRAIEEKAQREQEEQEKQDKIEAVLSKEEYEVELRGLYAEHPEMEVIFLNRDQYPDWLMEYLVEHEEVVQWVCEYPEYMEQSQSELLEIAGQPIPEDEKSQNEIPMLFQWDSRWGYVTYGERPIAVEGCGPTCLSMAAIGLTGNREITPSVVAEYALEKGYYVEATGTSWSLMDIGAQKFGLKSKQITTWSTTVIENALKKGKVVICSMGEGDFTSRGHFILLVGLHADGTVMINDPNSLENSEKTWDIQTILSQAKGMWEIGI